MPGQLVKCTAVQPGERLHQGEVLAGLLRVRQLLASIGTDDVQVEEIVHPFTIVLTQDCDLAQDADAREIQRRAGMEPSLVRDADFKRKHENSQKYQLENILVCEAMATSEMKANVPPGKDIWKRIIQNKDERYQCLEAMPAGSDSAGQGVPSLGCDFKRCFTVPADEIYRRIEILQIVRRCRLLTPYAEHLLHRFCNFQARIPLPENHDVPL